MILMNFEIERDDAVPGVDFYPLLKRAIHLADRGCWSYRLKLPSGRALSVRQIVARYNLTKYLEVQGELT